ncbi:MAG: hypothetical protein LBQ77_01115 [Treponema sp.]|jgi:diaminopimelate epimerase|nr:hypothetical protein [Treponema sp.]
MKCRVVIADPAKNITAFVYDSLNLSIAQALLKVDFIHTSGTDLDILKEKHIEQVGFIHASGTHLDMMGGEFCANAARSFGLLVARERAIVGNGTVRITVSGSAAPLDVFVHSEKNYAAVRIPGPKAKTILTFDGAPLPVYHFDGISHIIAPNISATSEHVLMIKASFVQQQLPVPALGVLFYDEKRDFLEPAVMVFDTNSVVFESSCGSGSAAFGVWRAETVREARISYAVVQPGGTIEVTVIKHNNKVQSIDIGGTVLLSPVIDFELHTTVSGSEEGHRVL